MNKFALALIKTGIAVLVLFAATFSVYFFNLDMKLVYKVQKLLGKHYDNQEKDRKL
ncbi:MAG: hypothetical protein LIO62_09155 [Clostridiales bacterium]|nr:hypothetical protein [Clostridiales bacterium]